MKVFQSYNHIMPQSILKSGWGYKVGNKISVNVLNYDRLRTFVNNNPKFTRKDLACALNDEFGEDEGINKNGLVMRRNTERIMGNRLVLNLTEQNFGNNKLNVEKDIERIIAESIKNGEVERNHIHKFYNWFGLQKSRSIAELMNVYSFFLNSNNISKINSIVEYLKFKVFYNKSINDYFNEYTRTYHNINYRAFIPQFNKELFLFLGELNTIHGANFIKCLLYHKDHLEKYGCKLEPIHYCLLNFIDISVIGKDKILLLCHPGITNDEGKLIAEAIISCWNSYQIAQENKTLVITPTYNTYINTIIETIIDQQKNGFLDENLNYQGDYLKLVDVSEDYEKIIKSWGFEY